MPVTELTDAELAAALAALEIAIEIWGGIRDAAQDGALAAHSAKRAQEAASALGKLRPAE